MLARVRVDILPECSRRRSPPSVTRELESYYYRKMDYTIINCKICASDLFKGNLKESINIVVIEYPLNIDNGEDFA